MKTIRRFLAIVPLRLKVPWTPYPAHWRSGQSATNPCHSLGGELKRQRLKLHLFQAGVSKRLGVSVVSVSNWERGVRLPSRRMRRKIRDLLVQGSGQQHRSDLAEGYPPNALLIRSAVQVNLPYCVLERIKS